MRHEILLATLVLGLLALPGAQAAPVYPGQLQEDPGEVVDPRDPTHLGVDSNGPGPVERFHANATAYHDLETVGVNGDEDLHVAPSTRNETLDRELKGATAGTPAETLWGWRVEQGAQGSVTVTASPS